jgi:hypothetical protein
MASQLAATGRMWQGFRELVVTMTEREKKTRKCDFANTTSELPRDLRLSTLLVSTWTYNTVEPRPCRVLLGLSYRSSE